jgi:hypothetical protein
MVRERDAGLRVDLRRSTSTSTTSRVIAETPVARVI